MARSSSPGPRADGTTSVMWLTGDALEVVYGGRVTAREVEESVDEARERLNEHRARFLIVDCTAIASYAADVRVGGVALLKLLKECGAESAVCVTPSAAVRMMAAAVAFVAGLPVTFFAAREDALRHLNVRRSQRPPAGS